MKFKLIDVATGAIDLYVIYILSVYGIKPTLFPTIKIPYVWPGFIEFLQRLCCTVLWGCGLLFLVTLLVALIWDFTSKN